jgi:hypothetical protein
MKVHVDCPECEQPSDDREVENGTVSGKCPSCGEGWLVEAEVTCTCGQVVESWPVGKQVEELTCVKCDTDWNDQWQVRLWV